MNQTTSTAPVSQSADLTPTELAELHGVPRPTAYRWLREGRIPYRKAGGRILISRTDAEEFTPPDGVVPHRYRGQEQWCGRDEMLWGAVGEAHRRAHPPLPPELTRGLIW